MTAPGGDAADRALDDALALANEPSAPRLADPLSVALGLTAEADAPTAAARSGVTGSAAGPGRQSRGSVRPGDPLSVALAQDAGAEAGRHAVAGSAGGGQVGSSSGRSSGGVGPVGQAGRSSVRPGDPLSVALGHGLDEPSGPGSRLPRPEAAAGAPGHGTSGHGAPGQGDPSPAPTAGRARTPDSASTSGTSPSATHAPARTGAPARLPYPAGHAHDAPAVTWPEARRIARRAGQRLPAEAVALGDGALGSALARGLVALTDLPSFDSSAMDGWAVAGPGPWRLKGQVLAGRHSAEALLDGHAARIATGAVLPAGATAVLRSEHGRTERRTDGEWLHVMAPHSAPPPGQDVRRRGGECRGGDELLPAGTMVTPIVLGLAAAAGYDELMITARPRVDVLVLGDELLDRGLPREGRVRDALGPMLPSWLRGLGADVTSVRRLVDDEEALHRAIAASTADLLVTTGGTAGGPVDHVHPVLAAIGAKLLVDGVAVRPGHPMVLAALPSATPDGHARHLIGLPGNPLAAVSGVLTLVAPLLRTLAGHPPPAPYAAPLTQDVAGHPDDTRLVPVVFDEESAARPLHFAGPAMLRGLAAADGMAVIPPGGARAGQETAVLDTTALSPAWGSGV